MYMHWMLGNSMRCPASDQTDYWDTDPLVAVFTMFAISWYYFILDRWNVSSRWSVNDWDNREAWTNDIVFGDPNSIWLLHGKLVTHSYSASVKPHWLMRLMAIKLGTQTFKRTKFPSTTWITPQWDIVAIWKKLCPTMSKSKIVPRIVNSEYYYVPPLVNYYVPIIMPRIVTGWWFQPLWKILVNWDD